MEHLFHPASGDYQVTLRRLLGLLDEGVEYHDPLADGETIKRSSDAFTSTGSYLKKPAAHGSRVRHAQVWPKLHQQFNELRIVGQNTIRPTFYLGLDPCIEVIDGLWHETRLADLITNVNRGGSLRLECGGCLTAQRTAVRRTAVLRVLTSRLL